MFLKYKTNRIVLESFNLHFQETFFVSKSRARRTAHYPPARLSISIFRRLSLFLNKAAAIAELIYELSISIFRRLSLFRSVIGKLVLFARYFQSPFSGDFLCFRAKECTDGYTSFTAFNLHFQETFFVSLKQSTSYRWLVEHFQSPFSGDFLCFNCSNCTSHVLISFFQSPFSGDFLCFLFYRRW